MMLYIVLQFSLPTDNWKISNRSK